MNQAPKVKIESIKLEENYYTDRKGNVYSTVKLIEHSKQYPIFDLPLAGIDLGRGAWEIDNLDDFIYHAKRCVETDLKYPIILDYFGTISDGCHRLCKAIVMGKKYIKAIRLETMPTPDRTEQKDSDQ